MTVWPRAASLSQTADPTYPVPPNTATFLGVAAVDRAATRAAPVERTRAAAERTGRAKERMANRVMMIQDVLCTTGDCYMYAACRLIKIVR